jgi:O-antigen chain-terminating methyltransferase
MREEEKEVRPPPLDSFLTGENRNLADWRWLWEGDHAFPIRTHRGFLGPLIVAAKKLLRSLVRAPQGDLWDRQRAYNLLIQDHLELSAVRYRKLEEAISSLGQRLDALGNDLQQVQGELVRDLKVTREDQMRDYQQLQDGFWTETERHWKFLLSHAERLDFLERFRNEGWDDIKGHTEAMFSRVDQKLDRYRQLSRERWGRLGALLEVARSASPGALGKVVEEERYVEFERLFRGREREIGERLAPYLEILRDRGEVLDLGCGRGEALEIFAAQGIPCLGVDSSSEMVSRCREKGLRAEEGDLFDVLGNVAEESLGGVVSFHVAEHLPPALLQRLVRLSWRALRPEGVLIVETPNPLSLVVAARNFWIDPTHVRPVHPESLRAIFELNGFDPVERIDLQPFAAEDRLPEVQVADLQEELLPLAMGINELRDRLDALVYGFQDYGMIGYKPSQG